MAGPVDLVLLRGMLPDVPLRPGAVVHGRVLDARTLVLEGVRVQAQLPEGVEPGQRLRLRVEETGAERLHLRVLEMVQPPPAAPDPAAAPRVPPTAYAIALPGGVMARIHVEDDDDANTRRGPRGGARAAVVVRYDSPSLGRLDVRLDQASAAVHVSAGEPADRVRAAAGVLREALGRATGAPVQVTVHPRGETLDVRA